MIFSLPGYRANRFSNESLLGLLLLLLAGSVWSRHLSFAKYRAIAAAAVGRNSIARRASVARVSIKVKSFFPFFFFFLPKPSWQVIDHAPTFLSLCSPLPRRPYKGVHIHKRGRVEETVGGWLRDDSPRLFYPDGMRERKKTKLRHKTEDSCEQQTRERETWIESSKSLFSLFFWVWAH